MATHQDNRPVTGRPPLTILRESERVSSIRISLLRALQDNYLPASGKLLTTSGVVDELILHIVIRKGRMYLEAIF